MPLLTMAPRKSSISVALQDNKWRMCVSGSDFMSQHGEVDPGGEKNEKSIKTRALNIVRKEDSIV
jgi:hypothetical protein